MSKAVGIELGTTSSVIAAMEGGQPQITSLVEASSESTVV